MFKRMGFLLLCTALHGLATETLHPVLPPSTNANIEETEELDDDIYSFDSRISVEIAPTERFSLYADVSYRFMSYSYEYSTEGYVHNYCNLHVNGFNETYIGIRSIVFKHLGIDLSWRFPPGEGSQLQRFHRMNIEPFTYLQFSKSLILGTSIRYNRFLDDKNYKPGDEIGIKASFVWKFKWNEESNTGWMFSETALFQARFSDSRNLNLEEPYRDMNDTYKGFKFKFDISRSFSILGIPLGFGIDYEIHKGTLFGFETGHRIGAYIKYR